MRGAGDPLLGRVLGARFAIVGARGFGASAAIYDAIDRELGDACSAKVLRSDGPAADEYEAWARHEVEILSRLPPGVGVALRGTGTFEVHRRAIDPAISAARAAFFVTDVAAGTALARHLGSLDEARARSVLATLLAKLDAMHGVGVVHGDLKPDHVFVDAAPRVTALVDFGSAFADDTLGRELGPTRPAATPAYAAPEGRTSASSDLFAAARSVRACLSPPLTAELDALAGASTVQGGLVPTLARCLAEDPARRPRSASEALHMLDAGEGSFSADNR